MVAEATAINVLLADGKTYPDDLVGTDSKIGLDFIRISADETLPTVTFGDSDKMESGDWALAFWHSHGLDQTVPRSDISAKQHRGVLDRGSYQDYLQTDAVINPGSGGGPCPRPQGDFHKRFVSYSHQKVWRARIS